MITSNIVQLAEQRGIETPKQLSEYTGISRRTCQKIILHGYSNLLMRDVEKMCEAFDCNVGDLFTYAKGKK